MDDRPRIDSVEARAYTVPTDAPESDGTYEWNATTLVVAHVAAAGRRGLGYTYANTATATLIRDHLGATQAQLDRIIPGYTNRAENLKSGGIALKDNTRVAGELGIV